MKSLEQEVFKYKKMAEREVDIVHRIVYELMAKHKEETSKLWEDILSLHKTTNTLQAQLYDVQNQNCEYEIRFKRISATASFRNHYLGSWINRTRLHRHRRSNSSSGLASPLACFKLGGSVAVAPLSFIFYFLVVSYHE